ncbi:MAG TPA: hypothetical protein VFZ60_01365 [Nitrososphaeraceae archaeon]
MFLRERKNSNRRWNKRSLPVANTIADLYSKIILLERKKTRLIPKIIMPVIRAFILNEHNTGQINAKFV